MIADAHPIQECNNSKPNVLGLKVRLNRHFWMNAIFAAVVLCGLAFASGYIKARVQGNKTVSETNRFGSQPAMLAPVAPKPDFPITVLPEKGRYLQVAVVEREAATSIAQAFRSQDFPVVVATGVAPGRFSVLIGPFPSSMAASEARMRLRTIGIRNPVRRSF
jgi:cell division protein FtsN